MADAAPQYTYPSLYLPRWDVQVPCAREGHTLYFPVAWFCDFLGVDRKTQISIIKGNASRFPRDLVLREVPFRLSGAWRMPLALRKRECAMWLLSIDPARCKPEMRDKIDDFQQDVMDEAERLLFGGASRAPAGQRGLVAYEQRERVRITCLECGTPHVVVIEDGRAYVVRDTE